MPHRRSHVGIPGDLSVIVGMNVDKAGGDEEAVGVEFLAGWADALADIGDGAVIDGDIRGERCAGRCRRRLFRRGLRGRAWVEVSLSA